MNWLESIIVGIIEGLTEFIPVSSTGHMIITEKLLHIPDNDFTKMFTVAIQLGAILAVVVLYRKKFFDFKNIGFYKKLIIGVLPALVLGLLFSKKIDELLESTTTVATTILLGGIVLLFIDKLFLQTPIDKPKETTFRNAVIIGFWQCLAMIPGVSRSAASIIGGMQQKLSRSAAAEFSFFLAVPTMLAATAYKLFKHYKEHGGFKQDEIQILALGNLVAFIVAILAIKFFIGFLKKHGFKFWGYYRITLGILLFILMYFGYIDK
jgi:undecaprenyl-diphosphatase